jgi:hypothetical protein
MLRQGSMHRPLLQDYVALTFTERLHYFGKMSQQQSLATGGR